MLYYGEISKACRGKFFLKKGLVKQGIRERSSFKLGQVVEGTEEEANGIPGDKQYYFRNNYVEQTGGRKGWLYLVQPPQSGKGGVRAEPVHGHCVTGEQPSEEKQLPKGGERKEAGSLREKYCPIGDGSGEKPLGTKPLR